jgi:hypothetical protein
MRRFKVDLDLTSNRHRNMLNNMSKLSDSRQQIRIQRMWKGHYNMVKRYRELPLRCVMRRAQNLIWVKTIRKTASKTIATK